VLEYVKLHEWPQNASEAVKIQEELKSRIILNDDKKKPNLIAAVDTAYNEKNNRLYASAVTVKLPELEAVGRAVAEVDAEFPYIPALLSFREGPVIIKALSRLVDRPDAIIFAGHGIAHPRAFGLASHLGLMFNIVSVGCARKKLVGEFDMPSENKGGCSPLIYNDNECGYVYRTKSNVKPMFISPGYKCSNSGALDIVVGCLSRYRMPVPLRLAHLYANKYRKSSALKTMAGNGGDKSHVKI
jgi:deoxyribonuclease V